MIPQEAQQAMAQWLSQATPPEQQLDRRWIGRYRELTSHDSYWWLSWAGPFTAEEQRQWDRLFVPRIDEAAKAQLAPLLKQSRERELEAALAEQREPQLHYPAIEIDEVRRQIADLVQLDMEIEREEPNVVVRQLYHGAIEDEANYLRIIEATYEGNTEHYQMLNQRLFHEPTPDEMASAFSWVRRLLQQGFEQPETIEVSRQLLSFMQERLHFSLDLSVGKDDPPVVHSLKPSASSRTISAHAVKRFYETILREGGYLGWQVHLDAAGGGVTRVEWGSRCLFLAGESFTLEKIRHLLAHELAGHVARSFAGEHSPLGILGIGTQNCSPTEEGLAISHERRVAILHGETLDASGQISSMLVAGLASGILTPPQTFSSLYLFTQMLFFLYRRLLRPWRDSESDQKYAHTFARQLCLRTFRGVPDLERAGVCYLQDVAYLRGTLLIERIVAKDETVLSRLAVGMIAYDLLPVLQSLQIVPPPQPLRELAYEPGLDRYILSFEESSKDTEKEMRTQQFA